MKITSAHVDLDTPTGPMRTYVYAPAQEPAAGKTLPGLIFYSEIFQQTPPIARMAMQCASAGHVVMVPEVYHEHLPLGTVLGYDDAGKDTGNDLKTKMTLSGFDADVQVLLDALERHPDCNGRCGVMGVCLGGGLAFRAALNPNVLAASCLYGTDIHSGTLGAEKKADSLERCAEIKGELLMIWGRQDPHVPLEGRRKIHMSLEDAGVRFTWHEFNADHAFMRDEGDRYNPALARLCYDLAFDLFRRNL